MLPQPARTSAVAALAMQPMAAGAATGGRPTIGALFQ